MVSRARQLAALFSPSEDDGGEIRLDRVYPDTIDLLVVAGGGAGDGCVTTDCSGGSIFLE